MISTSPNSGHTASLRFVQIRPIGQTSDMGCSLDEIRRCFIDIGGGK